METLLTPGPVPVPSFIMEAIAQPVIHHRTPAFEKMFGELLSGFKYLFQTQGAAATMIGSGTYGVEVAMYSLFRPGEKVMVLDFGKFSERWADYAKLIGLEVVHCKKDWGENFSTEEILNELNEEPGVQGVIATHCETSTGVCFDLEEFAFSLKSSFPDIILLADAITTVGAIPFYLDDWKVDCAVTASQKALMNPAGTTAFALSEQAQSRLRPTHHADFRNLFNYLSFAEKNRYPYTPPVQLFYGIKTALNYIQDQSLPQVWNRVHQSASCFRKGLRDLGGSVFCQSPSDSVTAFFFPGEDNDRIRMRLSERERIKISGGQGKLSGKIMRVSHMGVADTTMMLKLLQAMEKVR